MKVFLDTCILIDILRGNRKIASIIAKDNKYVINSIVFMEIIRGARDKKELIQLQKFLSIFEIIEIDQQISSTARNLIIRYSLGFGLEIADALIASTCIVHNLKLWTFNKKDFLFIENLQLFEPLTGE
jgi:predicted nucleic acid-binding protein